MTKENFDSLKCTLRIRSGIFTSHMYTFKILHADLKPGFEFRFSSFEIQSNTSNHLLEKNREKVRDLKRVPLFFFKVSLETLSDTEERDGFKSRAQNAAKRSQKSCAADEWQPRKLSASSESSAWQADDHCQLGRSLRKSSATFSLTRFLSLSLCLSSEPSLLF